MTKYVWLMPGENNGQDVRWPRSGAWYHEC